jgi:NAD(P)-dependent dehydrogenase (short-subunit alcohol dehydrogenase family)
MSLANSHILIVGGSKRIGRATADAALAAGGRVSATGRRAESLRALPEGATGAKLTSPTRPRSPRRPRALLGPTTLC